MQRRSSRPRPDDRWRSLGSAPSHPALTSQRARRYRSRPGPAPPPLGGYVTGHGVGLAGRRPETFLLPIASCLQGTILAPISATLATAGSVAHSHATFWLSAAAATGSGAKYIRVTKIASIETNTALPEARTHQTYVPGGTRHGDHSRHGGHGDSMASDVAFQGGGAGPGRDRYRRAR
jgi:hypothetical protein